ncbi:hypothetical protein [Leptospira ainazelensis]|nr:hypothetical protein [Leptospira ainazelensis]
MQRSLRIASQGKNRQSLLYHKISILQVKSLECRNSDKDSDWDLLDSQ